MGSKTGPECEVDMEVEKMLLVSVVAINEVELEEKMATAIESAHRSHDEVQNA